MLLSIPSLAIDKVTSSTPISLLTPSRAFADSALLDIGLLPLADGLELVDQDEPVFPEVRMAETIYFVNQLGKMLERSGAWGAVRVVASETMAVDLIITGKVISSNGEELELQISARDSAGEIWLDKNYRQVVGKYAYDRRLKKLRDPFHNLFTEIANDLLSVRETYTDKQAARLQTITALRFAQEFAPQALQGYLQQDSNGLWRITKLPAENDPLMVRIDKIRQRDYLYIDTMQDYYDQFSVQMHEPYQSYRASSYSAVVQARQLNSKATRQMISGIGAIIAGIYGRYEGGGSNTTRAISTVGAGFGGLAVRNSLATREKAAAANESVAEMGASLGAEIAPQQIELEDRTITLSGSVDAQYQQWKGLLREIYQRERALPSTP
ncbi:hypothetical protein OAM26_01285 [Porticoccaceae bacterium]|nr:hypothetical protein [Porticoccaceae bacterium]